MLRITKSMFGAFARASSAFVVALSLILAVSCGRSRRSVESGGGAAGALAAAGAPADGGVGGAGGAIGYDDQLCSLQPIRDGRSYAWDIGVVELSGRLTLNGFAVPDAPGGTSRGRLELRDRVTGDTYELDVGASGEARFSALVFTGSYDIAFASASAHGVDGLPEDAKTMLASGLELESDRELEYDLSAVSVTGAATVHGRPMPDSPGASTRGTIRLFDATTGDDYTFDVGPQGEARFAGVVFAGHYAASFRSSNETLVELPYGAETRVASALDLREGGRVSLDLRPVTAAVTVTSRGGPLPEGPDVFRGHVSLRDRETNTTYRFDVGARGEAAATGLVFAGSYELTFTSAPDVPLLPVSGQTLLAESELIEADSALSYDVTPARASGSVTLSGGALPEAPGAASRGSLSFRDRATGKQYRFELAATGAGEYSGLLFAGSYDVTFRTEAIPPPGLPASAAVVLGSRIEIGDDRVLDYDLRVVEVGGRVTSHGRAMPDSPAAATRGNVVFRQRQTGDRRVFEVGPLGDAAFSGRLFAGSYDVSFDSADGALEGLPSGASTLLASALTITSDQTLEYDVRPVVVTGKLGVNGRAMPDSPDAATRGKIALRDKFTNLTASLDVGSTGEAVFSTLVFEGAYDAAFQTASAELSGLPADAISLVATGCVEPGSCAGDSDDLSGEWTFVFDIGGLGPLTIALADDAGRLTGPFETPTFTGYLAGSRSDAAFALSTDVGGGLCSPFVLEGSLFGPCGASGTVTCGGSPGYRAHFTGFR